MKKKIVALLLVAALVAGVAFAGGSKDKGSSGSGKRVFGYTYWAASDFFETIGQTIRDAAAARGDEVIIVDAQQNNQTQLNIIDDFITRGVSVVFLNPVDRDAIRPALIQLKNAGIPVVNVDTSVADLSLVHSYIASDNVGAGRILGEAMNKRFPNGGDIAILDYPANSACLDRTQGFMETKNANFRVVAQLDAEGKPGPGLSAATDILTAHPNLVAFFCVNDQCGMGAYGAIVEANSKVVIYGVDGAPESKIAINEGGQFVGTAAQSPRQIGAKSIEVAYNILEGKPYEKEFYVPTFLIDSSNVKQYLSGWQ